MNTHWRIDLSWPTPLPVWFPAAGCERFQDEREATARYGEQVGAGRVCRLVKVTEEVIAEVARK